MRIIHYIPSIDRTAGGTTTYMQVLAKELGRLAEVHILTHKSASPVEMENCMVHYIPRFNPLSLTWRHDVAALLDELKPDVVHVNCCWMPACAVVQHLARKRGYKVVLTPHGMLEPWIVRRHYYSRKLPALWLYQAAAIRNADCLQATAEGERENLLQLGYNSNVKVVRLGIDADSIAMKTSWTKNRQILFLSRVHIKKGVNYLIEAATELRSVLQGYRILIAGEGDSSYMESIKSEIDSRELGDIIKLTGGVYGEEKWGLFQTSDFFVLPTNSENFGLAIAEALASGTPVITTVGTPWTDLNTSRSGACIEIGTKPLVDALRRFVLLSDGDLQEMGLNGRRLIETKYSARVMAAEMMKLYGELLA